MTLVLDEAQLSALQRSLSLFSNATRERGERYYVLGRVGAIEPFERGIAARVQGSDVYETVWDWSGGRWESDCSCPVGGFCKHAYALARSALSHARPERPEEPARERVASSKVVFLPQSPSTLPASTR